VAAAHAGGDAAKKAAIAQPGVASTDIDFDQPATLVAALRQAGRAFLLLPNAPDKVAKAQRFVEAAKQTGLKHLVFLSGIGIEVRPQMGPSLELAQIEDLIQAAGLPYTILRAATFMQNFIHYYPPQPDGKIYLPWGNSRVTFIDALDIARAAAVVLSGEGSVGQTFLLTGNESLTVAQVAQTITENSGKRVEYVPIPAEAARTAMLGYGMPDWLVGAMMELHQSYQDGVQDKVTTDFTILTRSEPHTFAAFVARNKAAFAP
jgi:uncharacterized protein YbjT (DUF2867 family)